MPSATYTVRPLTELCAELNLGEQGGVFLWLLHPAIIARRMVVGVVRPSTAVRNAGTAIQVDSIFGTMRVEGRQRCFLLMGVEAGWRGWVSNDGITRQPRVLDHGHGTTIPVVAVQALVASGSEEVKPAPDTCAQRSRQHLPGGLSAALFLTCAPFHGGTSAACSQGNRPALRDIAQSCLQ